MVVGRFGAVANNIRRVHRRASEARAALRQGGRLVGLGRGTTLRGSGGAASRAGARLGDGHPALLEQTHRLDVLVVVVADVMALAAPWGGGGDGGEGRGEGRGEGYSSEVGNIFKNVFRKGT